MRRLRSAPWITLILALFQLFSFAMTEMERHKFIASTKELNREFSVLQSHVKTLKQAEQNYTDAVETLCGSNMKRVKM